MSIQIPVVKCDRCGFKTSKPEVESSHIVLESIKAISDKKRKRIGMILYERTNLCSSDFKDLFDALMSEMGHSEEFILVDCMILVDNDSKEKA